MSAGSILRQVGLVGVLTVMAAGSAGAQWVRSVDNPVLSLGTGTDFDRHNIFAPAIVRDNGIYYLYYSGGPLGPANGGDYINYQIGLATGTDGVHFTKTGSPILPLGTRDDFHATPTLLRNPAGDLLKVDGRWHLFYCANRADQVDHATSTDGLVWHKDPANPIWGAGYASSIVYTGSEYRMYYIDKPTSGGWRVNLATGTDIHNLVPHAENPMLTVSQPWEVANLFYPYVLKEGNFWIMYYAAYWTKPWGAAGAGTSQGTAMGMAYSADGLHWIKNANNPVFKPTQGSSYDSHYVSSQAIMKDGNVYRMFYGSRIDQTYKYYAIGLATWSGALIDADMEHWRER